MKHEYLLFVLFPLFCFQAISAQTSYRVIGAVHRIEKAITSDFYIDKLEDRRAFKANLGIVNRGKNHAEKRALIPETGFWEEIQTRMNGWTNPKPEAQPVTAQVEELYLWENRSGDSGQGHVQLKIRFLEPGHPQGTAVKIEILGEELLVSKGHAPRLEAAFFQCLQRYRALRAAEAPIDPQPKSPSYAPERWASAASFIDLWEGDFKPANISLKKVGRNDLQRFKIRSYRPHAYYALAKGDEWFIKASNYFGDGDYYVQVLEKGRYVFLIDEQPAEGWQRLRLERQLGGQRVGILIDMETGVPQVVDDELLQSLMAPHPDLQDRYLFKDILEYPFQLNRVRSVIAEINRREENS